MDSSRPTPAANAADEALPVLPATAGPILLLSLPTAAGLLVWLFAGPGWVAAVLIGLGPVLSGVLITRRTRAMRSSENRLRRVLDRLRETLGVAREGRLPGAEAPEESLGRTLEELVRRSSQAGYRLAELSDQLTTTQRVLDATDEIILALAADGVVTLANRAADEFFSGTPKPLRGRSIEDLFVQTEILDLVAAAQRGRTRRAEVRIPRPDGRRIFHTLAVPGAGPEIRPMLFLQDVTEYQSAIQSRGDFVANVSHEMRTPLASIKGALETLGECVSDDPAMARRLVSMIQTNADRLEALTSDVLRLSRLEDAATAVELANVETDPLIDALVALFEPLCQERSVTIERSIDPRLSVVRTDASLFELIIKNLLENALKFAFEGTRVRLVGEVDGLTSRWRVIDQGLGIPLSQQQRIFDRFYQVDAARTGSPKRRGTGLGLAIVKNAVKTLEGSIRVESVWKQGTTMTVELPGSVVP